MKRTLAALGAIAIGGSLLSGCTPAAVTPSPSASLVHSPAPTVSSIPTTQSLTLAKLTLSPEGLGPLLVGQAPPVTDPEHDALVYSPTVCQWAVDEGSSDEPGKWVANFEPALHGRNASPFGVFVDDDGVLEMIAIYDNAIETATGIHLGSSAADVAAAYPARVLLEDHEFGDTHVYKIAGVASDLYIDVLRGDRVDRYPEIGGEKVVLLNVLAKGQPLIPFNSDFGLGLCVPA
jgi:hypothetical protein